MVVSARSVEHLRMRFPLRVVSPGAETRMLSISVFAVCGQPIVMGRANHEARLEANREATGRP
jgi:hypothetical protein